MLQYERIHTNENVNSGKCVGNLIYIAFTSSFLTFFLLFGLLTLLYKENVGVILIKENAGLTYRTDENFLSFSLDSSVIARGLEKFKLSDPTVIDIVRHLSPAYLRIGGNMADCLEFIDDNQTSFKYVGSFENTINNYCSVNNPTFTMNGSEWLELNEFARKANLKIVFDLNVLLRLPDDSWNSSNAQKLIEFSNAHNLSVYWQLGNEPNNFRHHFDNYTLNATQLAKDFHKLRNILNKTETLLIGPDTTRPMKNNTKSITYLQEFLETAGNNIDFISFHQYYFNGRTVDEGSFLNTTIFDQLKWEIEVVETVRNHVGLTKKNVWLSETSSAWGGGSPSFSDKFIACFIWLDKLGMAAQMGVDVVVRQSIFEGYYALISNDFKPNPDYWVSVLYKKLVSPRTVPCYNIGLKNVRLYCHCSRRDIFFSSITVFGINMSNSTVKIRLENEYSNGITLYWEAFAYTLTTDKNSLLGKNVYLNGVLLELVSNGWLPEFVPVSYKNVTYFSMPPFSIVFWIVPTSNPNCLIP